MKNRKYPKRANYKEALEKNPEIRTRSHRRAAWREGRRASFCTHVLEQPGKGTHAQRTQMWRGLWSRMSAMAVSMREERARQLGFAALMDLAVK